MKEKMRTIREIGNIKGKRVLLRVDLNVAMKESKVIGGYRVKEIVPTINYLKKKGAKVIIVGHIGRKPNETLKPVADFLNRKTKVGFFPKTLNKDLIGVIANMKEGMAIVLENVRSERGETENDPAFAKYLADLADIYVNDAFSASHRKHASIVLVPKLLPSYIGLRFEEELKNLSMAMKPKHPSLLILGGAKMETKIPLVKKFLKTADHIFLGGVAANDCLRAKGYPVGRSVVRDSISELGMLVKNKKVILPVDVVVKASDGVSAAKAIMDVAPGDKIFDAGPRTIEMLGKVVSRAKFILWNGPLGNYEEGFDKGTADILKIIAKSRAQSVIGGGDTLAVAFRIKVHRKVGFISTAGGAMLNFLSSGTLPGIEAIKKSRH